MRVAELGQEGGEGVEVEMFGDVRHPLPGFIIDELRQVGQGLIVGQHRGPSPCPAASRKRVCTKSGSRERRNQPTRGPRVRSRNAT